MLDKSFYINNRERLYEQMEDNSVAIFFSGREIRKSADVMYPFFANRNYYYLSGLEEPNAILILTKLNGITETHLFIEFVSETFVRWFGKRNSEEEINYISNLQVTGDSAIFKQWLLNFLKEHSVKVYLDLHRYDLADPLSIAEQFAQILKEYFPIIDIHDVHPIMKLLRTVKSDKEICLMRRGIEIAKNGFIQMMQKAKVGMTEYQLKAEFEYSVAYAGIRDMAFQPIITTGDNNFCIHYSAYSSTISSGDLILCDTGVNYKGLCCDISRTWPADRWFTSKQELYYQCALNTSDEMFSRIHPGMSMRDVYRMQHRLLRSMIVSYGIANDEEEAKEYIWHGGAHHIGFDNHDEVYIEDKPENLLSKNMVFAVDIGIYNPSVGIGLRVEDDCLITNTGCENLTISIPKEISDLRGILNNRL